MGLNIDVALGMTGSYTKTKGIGRASYDLRDNWTLALLDGLGLGDLGTVDLLYRSPDAGRLVLASANDDIDLSGIVLDALGDTLALPKVRLLAFRSRTTNTVNLTIGGAPSNAFAGPWVTNGKTTLKPGGIILPICDPAGYPVTPGTADILRVANGAADSIYDVLIAGPSV